jgi:hydrogenase maturation protease
MSERIPLLVLGLGNVLLEDDGAGAAAVARLLDQYEPPAGVRVFDGGTLGLALLPYLESADTVVLVDAVRTDDAPGSLVRLTGDDVAPAVATRLSPHQVGVADLLDSARWIGRYPRQVILLGVVPQSMELAVGLSEPVRAALPALVALIVEEVGTLGFAFQPRRADDTAGVDRAVDVARLAGMHGSGSATGISAADDPGRSIGVR